MSASLEAADLVGALREGVSKAFLSPSLAIYHRTDAESATLTQVVEHNLHVPPTLDTALLENVGPRRSLLLKAVQVQHRLRHEHPGSDASALVFHPTVALWGLIRDGQGELLGLVLLGPRGDDDPYEASDLRDLEQFMGTTGLAFTNSASFTAKDEARAESRELRAHAEQIEEQTRADIGGELHDYVLTSEVRLNLEALASLREKITDLALREELEDVAAREQTIDDTLRLVCDQLKPTGHHDPLGLALSLSQEAKWFRGNRRVPVSVVVEHEPVPLTWEMNRALVRITHEALNNAVIHAKPTQLAVHIRFPVTATERLVL